MAAVRLITHMGSDLTVVNAARVSFAKHKTVFDDRDAKLIGYLARNGHWTPFGHPQAMFRFETPIYVAAQLKRHTIGAVINEESRRYVDDEPEFLMPAPWRGRAEKAKQGSAGPLPDADQDAANAIAADIARQAIAAYTRLLDMGIAPEQARALLPQGVITRWYWTGSLYFWANLCGLRLHPHAQKETQDVAREVYAVLVDLFPVSWTALMKHAGVTT